MTTAFKAIRRQSDNKGDAYSDATAVDFSDSDTNPNRTRPEHAKDVKIENIISKFGGHAFTMPSPQARNEIDYTIELQSALNSIATAKQAHAQLPEDLRKTYPTWQALLTALDGGNLEITNEPPPTPVDTPPTP